MSYPPPHAGPDLVLETAVRQLRLNLDAALTEIEDAYAADPSYPGGLPYTFERPKDPLQDIRKGDIRGMWPQQYPAIRLVPATTRFPQSGLRRQPLSITDTQFRYIVRLYTQNTMAIRDGANIVQSHDSLAVQKVIEYTSAIRRVLERDVTPQNGATGVYASISEESRYLEPTDLDRRRGIIHITEHLMVAYQRVQRSQLTP